MKTKHLVASVGTLALMANLLLPGLAFGQASDPQAADVTLTCGTLTLTVDPANDFTMRLANNNNPSVSTSAQDVFGREINSVTYQDGLNVLPNEAFVAVNDARTVGGGAGCATNGTNEGWLLQADATVFDDAGSTNEISNANFYIVTTSNVTEDAGFTEFVGGGDGSDTNVFYTTGYAGTQDVTATYNVTTASSLTVAATFTAQSGALSSTHDILDNATGAGTNDFKFTSVGTGLAYYLLIPANQGGGDYTSTVTLDLITAT